MLNIYFWMPFFIVIPVTRRGSYGNVISLTLVGVEFLGVGPLLFQTVYGEKLRKRSQLTKCRLADCLPSGEGVGQSHGVIEFSQVTFRSLSH